jgi:hypothetical protein
MERRTRTNPLDLAKMRRGHFNVYLLGRPCISKLDAIRWIPVA